MAFSMVKQMDLKRKKWQSKASLKLQNTKVQVLDQFLQEFSSLFSSLRFRKRQERGRKNHSCSTALAVEIPEDLETRVAVEIPEDLETRIAVEIPEDIVEEILHRIPAKNLVRWKTVSKVWKSLIDSGHLAEKHLRRCQKLYGAEELKIAFQRSNLEGYHIKFFSRCLSMGLGVSSKSEVIPRVSGSCNGLVCVYDMGLVDLHIDNPTTGVIRTVTTPHQGTKLSVGFGRDVVTGAYKVVVLYRFDDDDGDRVETMVLDLSSSEWRRGYETAGPMPLSFTLRSPEANPVFVKGSLFWLLARHHPEILVMDLHTEKFRTVSLPKDMQKPKDIDDVSSDSIYMWSLKDRICISELRKCWDSDVWLLVQDEVSEKWERITFHLLRINPPLKLNSAWFTRTLVSPYQSSSSSRQSASAQSLSLI